jgi:cytochrome b subunit of formate dehydrogenase
MGRIVVEDWTDSIAHVKVPSKFFLLIEYTCEFALCMLAIVSFNSRDEVPAYLYFIDQEVYISSRAIMTIVLAVTGIVLLYHGVKLLFSKKEKIN